MADILKYIRSIQIAARGEEVRQSLVDALNGMNNSIPACVAEALKTAKESGKFDGRDGEPGENGVSPVVTVLPIAGGHRVIVADADHPLGYSFDVLDGNGAGDMRGSVYDTDNAVALAGGIAAYLGSNMQGVMRSGTYDPDNVVARAGGIAEYVAENAQEAMSFDNAPYRYSTNPVTSHGIYLAIQNLVYEIAEIKGRLSSLEDRVAAVEAGGNSGAGTGGASVDEDDLLSLRGAVVEGDYLLLDGTGATEDDGIIELDSVSSDSGASVNESTLSLSGSSVSENMIIPENGAVSDNILEL